MVNDKVESSNHGQTSVDDTAMVISQPEREEAKIYADTSSSSEEEFIEYVKQEQLPNDDHPIVNDE